MIHYMPNTHLDRFLESTSTDLDGPEKWIVQVPNSDWLLVQNGIWLLATDGRLPPFGWKIHISARFSDAKNVLEIVSETAFTFGCSFKYLSGPHSFLKLHFKNADRLQSGKFICLYPPTETKAKQIMDCLVQKLASFHGLDVLTDRAYKGSSNVFYRWGTFTSTGRISSTGEPEELVPNGKGAFVPDLRVPHFILPEGIVDPFSYHISDAKPNITSNSIVLDQFTISSVIRYSNAGGRYKGICQLSGVHVVIKEARPHTGYVGEECAVRRLRREADCMQAISSSLPGLAPQLLKYFSAADHEYIAMEYIEGTLLSDWVAQENPLYSCSHQSAEQIHVYFERVAKILEVLRATIDRLHDSGRAFGDLSPSNIIIDVSDAPRLIDFESCTATDDTTFGLRTPDFCLLDESEPLTAMERDLYAFHCIAISCVLRLTTSAEISDHVLPSISDELLEVIEHLPQWWLDACRYVTDITRRYSLNKVVNFDPPPLDSQESLKTLELGLVSGLLDCHLPDQNFLFPSSRMALRGLHLSHGAGCSGIFMALLASNTTVVDSALLTYTQQIRVALTNDQLPLGYRFGLAGVLETCTAIGLGEISEQILEKIERNWMLLDDPSLSTGLTGIALTLHRLGRASLAMEVMERAVLLSRRHVWKKNGLMLGRSGVVAGVCQLDGVLGGSSSLCDVVRGLIAEEYSQTIRHPSGRSLSLRGETNGNRLLPYLTDGTAGFALALSMADESSHLDFTFDEDDVCALAADLGTPFMLEPSLADGATGLSVALEVLRTRYPSLVEKLPDPNWRRIRKYLVPLKSGVGFLNPRSQKYDLSHDQGSAGIIESFHWLDGHCPVNLGGLHVHCLPR